MNIPVDVRFRGIEGTDAVRDAVEERVSELEQVSDTILSCRVMLEAPHRHSQKGRIHHVRIELGIPGGEIVASRDPSEHHSHEDLNVAIRDAFAAVRRQLIAHDERARGG